MKGNKSIRYEHFLRFRQISGAIIAVLTGVMKKNFLERKYNLCYDK
jgi:hypothetical protein